jgi:hypothetical protein
LLGYADVLGERISFLPEYAGVGGEILGHEIIEMLAILDGFVAISSYEPSFAGGVELLIH